MKKTTPFILCWFMMALCLNTIQLSAEEPVIQNSYDVVSLFPTSVTDIEKRFEGVKFDAERKLEKIVSVSSFNRTFENTVRAFDRVVTEANVQMGPLHIIEMVHPDKAMRETAQRIIQAYGKFSIDHFQSNKKIYRAFKSYEQGNAIYDNLNAERSYYLQNTMTAFRIAGLELPEESFLKMKELLNKINVLTQQFSSNISNDHSKLLVKKDELKGVHVDFIKGLNQSEGKYVLVCDYPTRATILEDCAVEATRRNYLKTFYNRAYPQNQDILDQLINSRDELAHLLGYPSYADLDVATEMAQSTDQVREFLDRLSAENKEKAKFEWKAILGHKTSATLFNAQGLIQPWNSAYILNQYKKTHFDLSNQEVAAYFPMKAVVEGMLAVYEKFFNLEFKVIENHTFWDPSVQMIEVREGGRREKLLGYLLLDMFPRENKYSHACCSSIVPPMTFDGGKTYQPALAAVICNFSKPTESKPSLLKHFEVKTFFHEFGHAVHAILGRAEMSSLAAYNTKIDFVETPSQLLEEWVWDTEILRLITRHYETGESMPEEMIQKLQASRHYCESIGILRQIGLAHLSLALFGAGQNKDCKQLSTDIYQHSDARVAYDPDDHMVYSFGHLTGYGAKYYSYVWSKEIANQLFGYIRTHGGPLNPNLGRRYVSKVIGRGGSCDPNELVQDFLNPAE